MESLEKRYRYFVNTAMFSHDDINYEIGGINLPRCIQNPDFEIEIFTDYLDIKNNFFELADEFGIDEAYINIEKNTDSNKEFNFVIYFGGVDLSLCDVRDNLCGEDYKIR